MHVLGRSGLRVRQLRWPVLLPRIETIEKHTLIDKMRTKNAYKWFLNYMRETPLSNFIKLSIKDPKTTAGV